MGGVRGVVGFSSLGLGDFRLSMISRRLGTHGIAFQYPIRE